MSLYWLIPALWVSALAVLVDGSHFHSALGKTPGSRFQADINRSGTLTIGTFLLHPSLLLHLQHLRIQFLYLSNLDSLSLPPYLHAEL